VFLLTLFVAQRQGRRGQVLLVTTIATMALIAEAGRRHMPMSKHSGKNS